MLPRKHSQCSADNAMHAKGHGRGSAAVLAIDTGDSVHLCNAQEASDDHARNKATTKADRRVNAAQPYNTSQHITIEI